MPASAAEIRRLNTCDVIRAIHALPSPTRKRIAAGSNLSFATISSIVASLIANDLVHEVAIRRQATGRPTAELALNDKHGVLLGVDIAETYVHVETFDSSLTSLSSTELVLDAHKNDARSVTQRVRDAIEQELGRYEGSGRRILGVGVSAPGQVDSVGGTSVFAPNWDWHNVPLLSMLRNAVDAPLTLDNPLKAMAIAELWSGSGRNVDNFVVLNIGTGVGAGIAMNRQVFRGRTNSAGEWGHTVLVADGRACRCGSRGCVEAYVGAPGIMQSLREIDPSSQLLHDGDQTSTLRALRRALDDGDAIAAQVLERTAHALGIAISNIVNMLNPELVVLGGWVVAVLGEVLLDAARPHITTHALATPLMATKFEIQQIAGNAVSLGAATSALEGYLDSLNDVTASAVRSAASRLEVAS